MQIFFPCLLGDSFLYSQCFKETKARIQRGVRTVFFGNVSFFFAFCMTLDARFDFAQREALLREKEAQSGLYNPDICEQKGYVRTPDVFSIILPPPNVTGKLHLGHASMVAFQDLMIRYHRMKGDKTLWLPGTDHAAISTQVVVEAWLAEQNLSRKNMDRAEFLRHCWDWTDKYRGIIRGQIQDMGGSLDWSRERFTLDPAISNAVETMFHQMYRDGLIFRGYRSVSYCTKCESTLSDDEVDHEDKTGFLYEILYKIVDLQTPTAEQQQHLEQRNGDWYLVVATTRPETLFGDTAVAVHPEDPRTNFLIGHSVEIPFVHRVIPVIGDEYVSQEKGTGCLKVTPAHDPNDFQIGKRHNLEVISVIQNDGKLNERAAQFAGQDRFVARKNIIAALETDNLLRAKKPHEQSIGVCNRHSDTPIETLVTQQWFIDVNKPIAARGGKSLKELMYDAVHSGQVRLLPENSIRTYDQWVENLQDWCISRQIWWGHQIPVWYDEQGTPCIDRAEAEAKGYTQDPDTLDTWFSSALWPFSTMGWPDTTPDMQTFFPNSVLETGKDILFFWVARMILMSTYMFGTVPFHTVYLHGMVCDEKGKKMSKSKGNGIDARDLTDTYGTDALRLAIVTGTTPGNNINFGIPKIEGYRNFITKIWNIYRFAQSKYPDIAAQDVTAFDPNQCTEPHNIWILEKYLQTQSVVTQSLEQYDFSTGSEALYSFIWNDFADVFVEICKVHPTAETEQTLAFLLRSILVILHPFTPFITQALWEDMGFDTCEPLLLVHPWPTEAAMTQSAAARDFEALLQSVSAVRSARAEAKLEPTVPIHVYYETIKA